MGLSKKDLIEKFETGYETGYETGLETGYEIGFREAYMSCKRKSIRTDALVALLGFVVGVLVISAVVLIA